MMKFKRYALQLVVLFTLLIIGGVYFPGHNAMAASAVKVAAVEYYDNNIIVFNNGNTKIYYATDADEANDNWDVINVDAGLFTMIDISWLLSSSENVIMIKGDLDSTVSRVVIKEKPLKLDVSINYTNLKNLAPTATIAPLLNIMSTEGTSDYPITYSDLEWKKGEDGKWYNTNTLTAALLDKFLVKGADLYFRIRAFDDCVSVNVGSTVINLNNNRILGIDGGIRAYAGVSGVSFGTDYPDGTKGRRFSDQVLLKISKKTASVVTGIDGEEFTAAIKYGKEYRVTTTYANGSIGTSSWTAVTDKSVKEIPLTTIANSVTPKYTVGSSTITFNGTTVAFPGMFIEIRDYATTNKAASKITEVSLDAQRTLDKSIQIGQPSITGTYTKDDIFVYYFGNKYMLLTIPKASADLPYEYCFVKSGDQLDLAHTSWNVVTKNTAVKLLASKAAQGATLYVRQKEIKYKAETSNAKAISYQLASTYVTHIIDYPSIPVATKANLTYTKGYSAPLTITVQLNEAGKTPFETTVTSLKLGTKEIGFTTSISPALQYNTDGTINNSNAYVMTITLKNTDLESLTNCSNRIVTITYANGTVDKASIKMSVKSPTGAGSLTLSAVTGGATGTTKVSVASSLGAGNKWVYVIGTTAAATGINIEDQLPVGTGTDFTAGVDIAITADKYITVYEIDANRNIIKYKSIQIKASMIK